MEIITYLLASLLLFGSSFAGIEQASIPFDTQTQQPSVELGLNEVSPKGEVGGFAIPASGCSYLHTGETCDESNEPIINVDKPIVRRGEQVIVSWNPNDNTDCILSATVTELVGGVNPSSVPTASPASSRKDSPEAMTTYSIDCRAGSDTATVKVLMEIEET